MKHWFATLSPARRLSLTPYSSLSLTRCLCLSLLTVFFSLTPSQHCLSLSLTCCPLHAFSLTHSFSLSLLLSQSDSLCLSLTPSPSHSRYLPQHLFSHIHSHARPHCHSFSLTLFANLSRSWGLSHSLFLVLTLVFSVCLSLVSLVLLVLCLAHHIDVACVASTLHPALYFSLFSNAHLFVACGGRPAIAYSQLLAPPSPGALGPLACCLAKSSQTSHYSSPPSPTMVRRR